MLHLEHWRQVLKEAAKVIGRTMTVLSANEVKLRHSQQRLIQAEQIIRELKEAGRDLIKSVQLRDNRRGPSLLTTSPALLAAHERAEAFLKPVSSVKPKEHIDGDGDDDEAGVERDAD